MKPIDSRLFLTAPDGAAIECECLIAAPVEAVYAAWSNAAAFRRAYDPARTELTANIELAIGGRYEWLWDGHIGSNDCQVLSYVPGRMLSFSWNAPPEQAESRARRTWVVVETVSESTALTRVRLTHLGFGSEAHWQETRDYFSRAWPFVLERFRRNLENHDGAAGA